MKTIIILLFASMLFAFSDWDGPHIESAYLISGKLIVVKIIPSGTCYPEGGSPPGKAIKYIYVAKDNQIVLDTIITGLYYPETFHRNNARCEFE